MLEILCLKDILSPTYQWSMMGNLYRTSFELFFLEIDMGYDVHSIPMDAVQLLATESLVKSTWQFLVAYNLELHHDIMIKPPWKYDWSRGSSKRYNVWHIHGRILGWKYKQVGSTIISVKVYPPSTWSERENWSYVDYVPLL